MERKDFINTVLNWQQEHGRHDLPWQQTPSPYRVFVSELMLQQTQVATVIPYFERWVQHFPTLEHLANANEDEVMALWQGLGYYSRARNLHKAAQYLAQEYNHEFPRTLAELKQIPGVGPYTAGAILSFAFDSYGPIVDGNVKRFFCRFFGIEGQTNSSSVNRQLWQKAEQLTPEKNNRRFAQGLLDIGATLCTPKQPKCHSCPFASHCVAFLSQRQHELPTPKVRKQLPEREAHFIWQHNKQELQLVKRTDSGIWASLWCLPELAVAPEKTQAIGEFKHIFSHFKMHAFIWQLKENSAETACILAESSAQFTPLQQQTMIHSASQTQWVAYQELDDYGLPTPIKKVIAKLWQQQESEQEN